MNLELGKKKFSHKSMYKYVEIYRIIWGTTVWSVDVWRYKYGRWIEQIILRCWKSGFIGNGV